jgi:hypothetical protein
VVAAADVRAQLIDYDKQSQRAVKASVLADIPRVLYMDRYLQANAAQADPILCVLRIGGGLCG